MLTNLEIEEKSDQKREIGLLCRQYIGLLSRDMEKINSLPDTRTKIAALIYFSIYNGKQTVRHNPENHNRGHPRINIIPRSKMPHMRNSTESDTYVQNPSTPEITWLHNDMNVIFFEYTGFMERLIWSSRIRFKCKQNLNVSEPMVTKLPFTDQPEKRKYDIFIHLMNEFLNSKNVLKFRGKIQ